MRYLCFDGSKVTMVEGRFEPQTSLLEIPKDVN